MGDVVKIPVQDRWLASFDLVVTSDGKHRLVLTDARTSLVEAKPTNTAAKIRHIAMLAADGADAMRNAADNFEESPDV